MNILRAIIFMNLTVMSFLVCSESDAYQLGTIDEKSSFLAHGQQIKTGVNSNLITALLYAKNLQQYKNIVVVNPGGEIPASAMSGLSEELAARGNIVYVIEYPRNLPILAPENAAKFARRLQQNYQKIAGLPEAVQTAHAANLPIIAFGHSLGGAVLGAEIGRPDSPFTSIALLGVSSLVTIPDEAKLPVSLILGEKDGLASFDRTERLAKELGASFMLVEEVNHFCVITDETAGSKEKRNQDYPINISHKECLERILSAWQLQ